MGMADNLHRFCMLQHAVKLALNAALPVALRAICGAELRGQGRQQHKDHTSLVCLDPLRVTSEHVGTQWYCELPWVDL